MSEFENRFPTEADFLREELSRKCARIAELEAQLSQGAEPVAWQFYSKSESYGYVVDDMDDDQLVDDMTNISDGVLTPLYTHPAPDAEVMRAAKNLASALRKDYYEDEVSEILQELEESIKSHPVASVTSWSPNQEYDRGFSDGWNRCEDRASRESEPVPDAEVILEKLDNDFNAEINRVSHIKYDSNEICRNFYSKLREVIAKGWV